MRKNILTVGLLALSLPAMSQVVMHVDSQLLYVGKGALLYNGGGMQVKQSTISGTVTPGTVENHGSVMLAGTNVDVFKTLDNSDTNQGVGNTTAGKFINALNEPGNYASANTTEDGNNYTYGQLFITGFAQGNILGVVDQQYKNVQHGAYEQIAFPFYNKSLSSLNSELGKIFNTTRRSMNEILMWDNRNVVFDHFTNLSTNTLSNASNTIKPYGYFSVGAQGLDVSSVTRTMQGTPVADGMGDIPLKDAGLNTPFGTGGNNNNAYGGRYNTYVQDSWAITANPTPFVNDFGRNMYQFGNPYLTNLDLQGLLNPNDATNYISNIQGIRIELAPGTVTYNASQGGGTTSARYISYDSSTNTMAGDADWTIVRPNSVFVIKLKDNNNTTAKINFDNLRKFRYFTKANFGGGVTNKGASTGTLKQLGVIALDANGAEIGRTYYVVSPYTKDGFSNVPDLQVAGTSSDIIGTYEEDQNGGYDTNLTNAYWLYINEANETTFQGKAIPMVMYSPLIKSLKYEIRENAVLVPEGTTDLSTGIGFYYKLGDGTAQPIAQGQVIPVTATLDGTEGSLYYGKPNASLGSTEANKPSRTRVVYNQNINNFIVLFDPNWKKAEVKVFDMSGKLVFSKTNVNTSQEFVIELSGKAKNSYVVSVTSEKGDKVNAKIIK